MNGFVFRMPLVWLVAMGLVACGAAGETPAMGGPAGTSTDGTTRGDGPLTLGIPLANADQDAGQADDGDDDDGQADEDADELDDGHGDDESSKPTPGIDVSVGDDGILVLIDMPDGSAIRVDTRTGHCTTTGTGVDIEGDVTIHLGTGLPLPLADANLHVEMGSGTPTLSGTAKVSGSLLEGIGCGCADDLLPVAVSLEADALAGQPGSAGNLALVASLAMKDLDIDAGALPLGLGSIELGEAEVSLTSDGVHRWLSVAGQVKNNADIWASTVPLRASGALAAVATLTDGALLALQIQSNVTLEGGKLWCGITPLRELTMPAALVTLDQGGLWLHATAQASAHPGFSVTGNALVDGRFTPKAWSLTICADVMTDILSASVKIGQCVDMTPGGAEMCDCHEDDDGHCDGGV
jgi:hypothetical protein